MILGSVCDYPHEMTQDRDSPTASDSPHTLREWMSRWQVDHESGPRSPVEQAEDPTVSWAPAASRDPPTPAHTGPPPSSSSASRDPKRRLAWVHAYLAADDPQGATVCFCEILNDPSVELDPSDALELAEELATAYLQQGEVDDAADLLRFTVAWSRGELGLPIPVISGRTVVASNPLLTEPETSRTLPETPSPSNEHIDDEAADTVRTKYDREDTTAVFMSPFMSG